MMNETNGIKKHLWATASAIIVVLLAQTMAAVWWASSIDTRMEYVERDLADVGGRVHALEVGER